MKPTRCFILALLIFLTLTFVPNSFAQTTAPHNMVRLIYFVPRGRTPQPDMNTKLDKLIKDVQALFADEMERHGFGRKTFVFEADRNGNAVVHRVNGSQPDAHYHRETLNKVNSEISQRFDFTKNVYFMVVDVSTNQVGAFCGWGGDNWSSAGDRGGHALTPASGGCLGSDHGFILTAHELGHAFGLLHDFSSDAYIMSYGANKDELAPCSAEWLDTNRYFNTRQTPSNRGQTTIEMLPAVASPPYGVRFRFKVSDPDGLQIAHLLTPATAKIEGLGHLKLLGCKNLTGESQTIEFVTTQLTAQSESVDLRIIDSVDNLIHRGYQINISNVSPASKTISIPDANLAAAVRDALGLTSRQNITTRDMLGLKGVFAWNKEIRNLTGLEHARNLKYLHLSNNQISDISILTKLPNLTEAYLASNKISDFTPIAELTNLVALDLSRNLGDDISPVTKLTQLNRLSLNGYKIQDLTPFAGFTNLRHLDLGNNRISDLTPLTGFTNLRYLDLGNNQISNLTPLSGLTQLTDLWLWINQISDLTPLTGLMKLRSLGLSWNQTSDITALVSLKQLERLYLNNNQISDVRPLTGLIALSNLRLAHNLILNASVLQMLLQKSPDLELDIDIPQATPVVQVGVPKSHRMYWIDTERGTLHRTIDDSVENLVPSVRNATSLAVDAIDEKLYWTEKTSNRTGKIRRANFDGSNVQLVKELTSLPLDIAVDAVGGKVYLTNAWGKFQRLNVDGTNFEPNLITGLESTTDFALDVAGGKVYWTENAGRIRRANLDGNSEIETLVSDLGTPAGIVITGGKLYWTEQTDENAGKIQRTDLNGGYVETLATLPGAPHGIAVDAVAYQLYWTNALGGIQRANLSGGNFHNLVTELTTPGDFALHIRVARVLVAESQRPPMYWVDANAGTLHRLTGVTVENIVPSVQNVTDLAVDVGDGKLYWIEKTGDRTSKIQRANLNGTNVELVKELASVPHGIALDPANRRIYLTNAPGKVQRLNFNGLNFQINLVTGLKSPSNLVVDTVTGRLYWIEQTGDATGKIQRANLDGSNVQLVRSLTSVPRDLSIDTTNGRLYLTNSWEKIQRLSVAGSNFQPNLITDLDSPEGLAVDMARSKLYWTEAGGISYANLDGSNIQKVVTGLGAPTDIVLGTPSTNATVAAAPAIVLPDETTLLSNYPNPFNPETWIPYLLAEPADVTLHIYAVNGALVRTLALGHQPVGIYQSRSRAAYWDGRNEFGEPVASGLYFYTLTAGDFTATRKMLIRK